MLTLYYMPGSAPCHQVMLTASALNLQLELKPLDLTKQEHLNPEFVKINPQHTIPTLTDGDFVLWESRAISRYLVNQYGAGSSLYPVEPRVRALVDQRLDFDFGTLYHKFADYFYPQILEGKPAEEAKFKKLQDALGWLNLFLESSTYVAGAGPTIADLAILASVAVFDALEVDLKPYPNVVRWFEMMRTTASGYQEAVQKNLEGYQALIEKLRKKPESS